MEHHNAPPMQVGGSDRFTSAVSASGNSFPQQSNVLVGLQGYYPQDMGYTDAASYSSQAYQPLAYAGVSSPQPYWTFTPYGEGSTSATHTNPQEINLALRDRDAKTQRRKEANRESARRSKQRKKEESEVLSTKAQDLIRESTTLRNDLEKMQKQADKLYSENMELRSQVAKAGGSLPPSPERVKPVKIPPPIELPLSLLKDAANLSNTTKKETPVKNSQPTVKEQSEPSMLRTGDDVLAEGDMDLPSLLDTELANPGGVSDDGFSHLPLSSNVGAAPYPHLGSGAEDESAGDMLMSEAIVSFREPERVSLFTPSSALEDVVCRGVDDDMLLGGELRSAQFVAESLTDAKALSRKSEGDPGAGMENFHLVHRSEIGQGG